MLPFIAAFSFRKRKNSAEAKFGGGGMITVLVLVKNYHTSNDVEMVCYHGEKSMIDFSTILCVSGELLGAIGS